MKNIQKRIKKLKRKINLEVKQVEKLAHELFQIAQELVNSVDKGKKTSEQAAYEIMDLIVKFPPQLSGGFLNDLSELAFNLEVRPGNRKTESVFKTEREYKQAWRRLKNLLKSGLKNIN
jgi:hypothetical protein